MEVESSLKIKGRFRFAVYDADGTLADERINDNLLMPTGLGLLASALDWAMIQNQNTLWGSPYSLVNLGDCYGLVGTGTAAALSTQTSLQAEIGRAIVTNSTVFANQLALDFFFPLTQGNGAVSEVGMVLQGNLISTTLTSALVSGSAYTSLAVVSTTVDVPTGSLVTVGYGTGQTQTFVTSSDTPPGSTTMAVVSTTANANYAGGSMVAYTPGWLLDRTVFVTPVTKTSTQTAILEVTLTLISG